MKTKRISNPYEFAGFDDWIEVFQAGTQTDAHGQTKTFSQSDLDSMIVNHQPAPIVIGHPKTDDPAYGWSRELKREGDSLYAKFTDVEPQFEHLVEKRRYPERSIRIAQVNDGYKLVHVGFLGAARPAIEGMKPIQFNADDDQVMEFSGEWLVTNAMTRILRRFKNFLIQDKGEEVADSILPEYDLETLSEQAASQRLEEFKTESAFSQSDDDNNPTGETTVGDITQEQLDAAVAKAKADTKTEVEGEYAAKLEGAEFKQRQTQALQRVDNLLIEQKLLPAQAQGLAEFMASLDDGNEATFEFSVGEGEKAKTQKQSPYQFFNAFLDNLPKHGVLDKQEPGDFESQDFTAPVDASIDGDRLELHNQALDYMNRHQGVNYVTAVKAVGG